MLPCGNPHLSNQANHMLTCGINPCKHMHQLDIATSSSPPSHTWNPNPIFSHHDHPPRQLPPFTVKAPWVALHHAGNRVLFFTHLSQFHFHHLHLHRNPLTQQSCLKTNAPLTMKQERPWIPSLHLRQFTRSTTLHQRNRGPAKHEPEDATPISFHRTTMEPPFPSCTRLDL